MGTFERHSDETWRKTARALEREQGGAPEGAAQGVNANGAPLLGDSRDLFRPKTSDIPASPGVYKWRDGEGRVIYVGKAKNLRNRLTNYFQPLHQLHPRTQTMVLTARSLEWTVVGTELEALTLEYTWIKEFDPRFNVVFRDDKTYPYLAMSVGEAVPRIWITRNRNRKDTRYYGPYAKVWNLKQSLDRLLKTFPVRTCTPGVFKKAQLTGRPCLLGYIGKCCAPCVGWASEQEHRRLCEHMVGVLTGRLGPSYIADLTRQMKEASADLEFEKAARLRDDIAVLREVGERNAVVLEQGVDADVFAIASDELEACVHAFFVRDGMIRGERNWSVERGEAVDDAELMHDLLVQAYGRLVDEPVAAEASSAVIRERRDAMGSTQRMTAADSADRARATRRRHERRELTGRADLLAPISPVPREVLVGVEPSQAEGLQSWLSQLRGSRVTVRVPSRGEKRDLLERAGENAAQALQRMKMSRMSDLGARTEAMNEVADALGLSQAPLRIECYDISNTVDGSYQVGSMVVFEDAVAKKSEYRRFAVRGKDGSGAVDDLSALYEVLTRRFGHGSGEQAGKDDDSRDSSLRQGHRFAYTPNLVVVDGGKPQVMAAAQALADCGVHDVAVCGLAKRLEEVWVPDDDYPVILKRSSEGLYLLQRVRDESHRFAIDYHRKTRRKGMLRSALDSIPGIGPAYQKKLLAHFGSVRAIREAGVDQLKAVPGLGDVKAQAVYDAFHHDGPGRGAHQDTNQDTDHGKERTA
ncbi:excinuclease ABC subunit UvrC [Bifidobacterium magnum]|uniref:UvrABC system protein C n=1 Tax=Bifidobacterium magnum TaxID=1692 RepID=A0A087BA08_9BIFI|nr:excinuclease ABC subunit UvrC [Bifidobacterium magnum]KFI67858.1 Excinuclease ABC subunit C [Bifidobacterium magnum]